MVDRKFPGPGGSHDQRQSIQYDGTADRLFYGDPASAAWYWWRWAGNAPASVTRTANRRLPAAPRRAPLVRRPADGQALSALLDRFGISAGAEIPDGVGDISVAAEDRRLVLHTDGSYEMFFAEPNRTASLAAYDELRAAARTRSSVSE